MQLVPTALPGVVVVRPTVHHDARGHFLELSHAGRFADVGLPAHFAQVNQSRSVRGVVRGLHLQTRRPQGKLVTAVRGTIWDVAVDVRRGSPTFGQWVGVTLDADDPAQLWIPPGFAHGFCVLSEVADVVYQCTDTYDAGGETGVAWDDPAVGIAWPVRAPILSARDVQLPPLDAARDDLPVWEGGLATAGTGTTAR